MIYANRIRPVRGHPVGQEMSWARLARVIWASEGAAKLLKEALAKRGVKDIVEIRQRRGSSDRGNTRFNEGEPGI